MTNGDRLVMEEASNYSEPINQSNTDRFDSEETTTPKSNGLGRLAFGILIGATLGGIATALANKNAVNRINKSVQDLGNTAKKAASGIKETVKEVGDAVQNVAIGIDRTYRDVETTVMHTAVDVDRTVKDAMNAIKNPMPVENNVQPNNRSSSNETLYKLIPDEQSGGNGTLYKLIPLDREQGSN